MTQSQLLEDLALGLRAEARPLDGHECAAAVDGAKPRSTTARAQISLRRWQGSAIRDVDYNARGPGVRSSKKLEARSRARGRGDLVWYDNIAGPVSAIRRPPHALERDQILNACAILNL